jgi:hypothetical protein
MIIIGISVDNPTCGISFIPSTYDYFMSDGNNGFPHIIIVKWNINSDIVNKSIIQALKISGIGSTEVDTKLDYSKYYLNLPREQIHSIINIIREVIKLFNFSISNIEKIIDYNDQQNTFHKIIEMRKFLERPSFVLMNGNNHLIHFFFTSSLLLFYIVASRQYKKG